jgi:Mn-dependent DtxR family transcriptional regulator
MKPEEKCLMRYILLLSCVKKGHISIKKASRKLEWSRQKVLAVGKMLCEKGVLTKDFAKGLCGNKLVGYNLENF